ncbi:MAG: glycerophosphodiester phosphodiesterase [Spirochaetaceae bacterium]|nr:MAG: glycerophosphodiester phosphodiesterase [Spirochaetaceae bacterium]
MNSRRRRIIATLVIAVLLGGLAFTFLRSRAEPLPQHPFFNGLRQDRALVIAHRGGAALWPENTLTAFAGAWELGVDVLEMDVHLTADGVPVVIHDSSVDRTTDGSGEVRSFTLAELQELDAAYYFSPLDAPGDFSLRGTGITIPTLRELFDAFPDAHMVVESKEDDIAAAEIILQLVQEYERADRTLLASFSHRVLQHFRSQDAHVATHASEPEVTRFLAASWLLGESFVVPDYESLFVPPHAGRIPVLTSRFVNAASNRNIFVAAWTINDKTEMFRLLNMGVNGLITDQPDMALDLVGSTPYAKAEW